MRRKRGWFARHLAFITRRYGAAPVDPAVFHNPDAPWITAHACGVSNVCPGNHGGPHVWDGPELVRTRRCDVLVIDDGAGLAAGVRAALDASPEVCPICHGQDPRFCSACGGRRTP